MTALPSIWRRALPAVLAALLWLLFWYRETAQAMVAIWARSDTFTHGFIVPPLVLWLIWRQRQQLAALAPRPCWLAALPLAALSLLWLLGQLAAINALTQFAFVAQIIVAVPLLSGWPLTRQLGFPLAFLLLAVPFGDFMMPQLMEWTAGFTVIGLRLTGIPVYREGLQFVIPSGSWSVVEACSGVRYLIASFTVGALFAYLNYNSWRRRLVFIAVAIVVPIFANWLRAYLIVLLGHVSGNKLAAGVDHLIYGWVFFGAVIMLMFVIGARWAEPPAPFVVAANSAAPAEAADTPRFWLAALLLAVLAVLPHALQKGIERWESAAAPQLLLGNPAGGWQRQPALFTDWVPAFQNPSTVLSASFARDGQQVGLYLGYYRNQDYERKLVSSENLLVKYKDKQWARVEAGAATVDLIEPGIGVRTAELRAAGLDQGTAGQRLLVWQIYWINGRLTASDHLAKAYNAFSRLFGQGDDAAVVILYAPKEPEGQQALQAFARDNGELIAATLRQARNGR